MNAITMKVLHAMLVSLVCMNGCVMCQVHRLPNDSCETLYLLNVLPYPWPDKTPSLFDRGSDLVPAGRLATKHINCRKNILSGYRLELIDVYSEPCDSSTAIEGQINFLEKTLHGPADSSCIVGVIGLYCSTATQAISLVAGHPLLSYIRVAASTSPLHRNNYAKYPHLFHTISSSTAFNEAVVAMMKEFGWERIGQIHDPLGLYLQSTANDFAERIHHESDLELITRIPFVLSPGVVPEIFDILNKQEARISYWSLTTQQVAENLCEAYHRHHVWPGYVYITHDFSVSGLRSASVSCSHEKLLEAAEGMFLLTYRLHTDATSTLVSGITYNEYYHQYMEELADFANRTQQTLTDTVWANPLYDQVWAFALTLDSSLKLLSKYNLTFSGYVPGRTDAAAYVTKILESKLKKISFEGVTGAIKFTKNLDVKTLVNIYQVRNRSEVLVGVYDPLKKQFVQEENVDTMIPKDRFETVQLFLPIWLGLVIILAQGCLIVLVTFNLVCFLAWRDDPHIKATGLPLSILIIAGCYILCLAPVAQTIGAANVSKISDTAFTILCNLEKWLQLLGIPLIFATLFVRLLRIVHLFRVRLKRTGKYWSDSFLIVYIILICSVSLFILIVWTSADPLHKTTALEYVEHKQPPHYEEIAYCSSKNVSVWIVVHFAFFIILVIMVMFLAIQTRHIKHQNFKDTKKVNMFVFGSVIIATTSIPLWFVFVVAGIGVGSFIVNWMSYFCVTLLCQLFLFVPKTVPLLRRKFRSRRLRTDSSVGNLNPLNKI